MFRPFPQLIRLVSHNLYGMHPRRRARRIGKAATNHVQRGIFRVHGARLVINAHLHRPLRANHEPRMHRRKHPACRRILGRFGGCVIRRKQRQPRLPRLHAFQKILAPQFLRRHLHQVLDVNRGDHSLFGAIRTSVAALHANTFSIFDNQRFDPLIRQDRSLMSLDKPRQRRRQRS